MPEEDNPVLPLALRFTRHAEFDLANALSWLSSNFGEDTAARFSQRFDEDVTLLRQSIADEIAASGRHRAQPHEAASVYFSRPIYRHAMQTTKKRARRSSAGLWHIYYEISDRDTAGQPNALVLHAIQHSAAQPYSIPTD